MQIIKQNKVNIKKILIILLCLLGVVGIVFAADRTSQTNSPITDNNNVVEIQQNTENYIEYWKKDSPAMQAIVKFVEDSADETSERYIPVEDRMPIKIFIDSGGGDLCATLTMIDAIEASKTPVWTINIGTAYSGGFFTFIAGHKRFAYPHATFLYHEGSTMNGGDAGKFRNFAEFYDKQLQMLKNITLKYTNISDELYESKKRDDWWITTDEAIELGICDEIWGIQK